MPHAHPRLAGIFHSIAQALQRPLVALMSFILERPAFSVRLTQLLLRYHSLRNAMWMRWKLIPTSLLIRNSPWLLLAHLLTIARQTISGRPGVLFALYRDAFKQLPAMLRERARFQAAAPVAPSVLGKAISKRFYRQGYAVVVLSEWTSRWHNLLRSSR